MNAQWLGVLGAVALGCAPMHHGQQARAVASVGARPQMSCHWQMSSTAARHDELVEVSVRDEQLCTHRGYWERPVQVDSWEYPDPGVLAVEAIATVLGAYMVVDGWNCPDPRNDFGCGGAKLERNVGAVIFVPAAIATTVDLLAFESSSRDHLEYSPLPVHVTKHASRPRSGVPVRLELDDGDTVRADTDAQGKARLPVIATPDDDNDFVYGVLHVGASKKRVRFRR